MHARRRLRGGAVFCVSFVVLCAYSVGPWLKSSAVVSHGRLLDHGEDDDSDDQCTGSFINSRAEDQCQAVKDHCDEIPFLVNYLQAFYCTAPDGRAFIYFVLLVWLTLLISLLATTADYYFVPPLEHLSFHTLKLSPEVAGITLLAFGNGAPDVFGALAGINGQDDFQVVLGALLGASIFISSVVLGAVLLVASPQASVDSKVFKRDLFTYMAVVALIAGIASDGHISIFESIGLLITYFLYVALVVALSRSEERASDDGAEPPPTGYLPANDDDSTPHLVTNALSLSDGAPKASMEADLPGLKQPLNADVVVNSESPGDDALGGSVAEHEGEDGPEMLAGLVWPTQDSETPSLQRRAWVCLLQSQVVLEGPFTILRWCSTPGPIDGYWTRARWITSVAAPTGFFQALLVDSYGPDAYSTESHYGLPIFAWALLVGLVGSAGVYVLTRGTVVADDPKALPAVYSFLALGAFASSVVWMDLIANEAVALMESLGVILEISTAVLGLTVLALGNSVGDLIADLAVARTGQARMAVATCFGSPLLNDILGLGIALTLTCAQDYPRPFRSHINRSLIIAWAFLGASLLSSLAVFHYYNYKPPRKFAYFLFVLYTGFVAVSIANELM